MMVYLKGGMRRHFGSQMRDDGFKGAFGVAVIIVGVYFLFFKLAFTARLRAGKGWPGINGKVNHLAGS